jgi:hypothetical protein
LRDELFSFVERAAARPRTQRVQKKRALRALRAKRVGPQVSCLSVLSKSMIFTDSQIDHAPLCGGISWFARDFGESARSSGRFMF